jgi:hypothetical protein
MSSPIVAARGGGNGGNDNDNKNGRLNPTPGRAAVFAFGRAFPAQEVKQELLTEGYLRDTNCNDPVLKAKLERLCELVSFFFVSISPIRNRGLFSCRYETTLRTP